MKQRLLIVDDESAIRVLLRTMLEKEGYEVLEAADAAAMRELLSGPQPDVIMLDLKLPDSDGIDLLPLVKKNWPTSEVIVLTGHATIDAAVATTKAGAYDFQKKPFDPKGLLLCIERAIEHKVLTEETSSLRQALATMS